MTHAPHAIQGRRSSALLPGKEFLITERSGEIDADIIRAGYDLRLIQRLGATYDIDLDAARRRYPCLYPVGGGLYPRGRARCSRCSHAPKSCANRSTSR